MNTDHFTVEEQRLQVLLLQRLDRPFAWGLRDCAMWAADAVQAVHGYDPAQDLRATYWSGLQAARVIKRAGGLAKLATARLGREIKASQAVSGDVALMPRGCTVADQTAAGALAVYWRGGLIGQGENGLVVMRPDMAVAWWRGAR